MSRLLALVGPRRGVALDLERRLVVGRGATADLMLIDEKVSREHCAFEPAGEGWTVGDLNSRNGTWVNGERVAAPVRLKAGDQVGVGDSVLVFDPPFEPVHARDGSTTILLTATAVTNVRAGGPASGAMLEKAGELALRAAMAGTEGEAAALVVEAAKRALRPQAVALLVTRGRQLRVAEAWPESQPLSIGRALVDEVRRHGKPLAMAERQTRAESDAHTTRLRARDGELLCAPLFAHGEFAGVLCATRDTPFEPDEIALAGALAAAAGGAFGAREKPHPEANPDRPVAESPSMREAMRLAAAASLVPSTVLLTGESGTGKEELARVIHGTGARAEGPFIAVNCGAIPAELAESELFGHEKGAFTGAVQARPGVFEQADGGTLFLDEVGDLPLALQVKLLRVLQERVVQRVGGRAAIPVDVRIVAATHRDLPSLLKSGGFRDDLFWRLNVVAIPLLPLRDRREDVLPLADRFLARLAVRLGRRAAGFTAEAKDALGKCAWPGNARQLANAIERALVLREGDGPIGLADLPAEVLASTKAADRPPSGATLNELIRTLEREQITLALKRAKGVKVAAAEALGISRPTLDRKIEEYRIDLFE
jgi:DNA-binding NtrC family response regulator